MPDDGFIKEMKSVIKQQQHRADIDKEVKLHDGRIIKEQFDNKWDEIVKEVRAIVEGIAERNFRYLGGEGRSFRLYNDVADNAKKELHVKCESDQIRYSGASNGVFYFAVSGSQLVYSDHPTAGELTPKQVAEKLVRLVVGYY